MKKKIFSNEAEVLTNIQLMSAGSGSTSGAYDGSGTENPYGDSGSDYGNSGSSGSSGSGWFEGGYGTSEDDCMLQSMYDMLFSQGTSVGNLYVCGWGFMPYPAEVIGSGATDSGVDDDYGYGNSGSGDYYDPNYPGNASTGGGGGGSPTPPPADKKPEKRNDCSESAVQNAMDAEDAMNVSNVLVNVNFLREYAKGQENEWSVLIDSYYGGYIASGLREGKPGSVPVDPNENTVYDVHSHSDDTREGYSVLTGPSMGDVQGMFKTSNDKPLFKGTIIISYDGSEYLLAVNDRAQLQQFWANEANRELFKSGEKDMFENINMNKEYWGIIEKLEDQGFTYNDAHDYATSYMLDEYGTGLKISKKSTKNEYFKELKTENRSADNYQPTICP